MQLAQLNVAKTRYPLDDPRIKDFVDNLDRVNAIAEASEGFIWRLKDDAGNATNIKAFDDPDVILNMSVWSCPQTLKDFLFKTIHRDFLRRKSEWFFAPQTNMYVLWWIEDGHIPTIDEALERLTLLQELGESPEAFSFKSNYPAPSPST
ncbi:DUF3291 domain-containing protein [Aestuariibacter sp. GS-14]|uniref:DUF3291 domain-containing protein n=1 Tax=Aestuariibacter sp. GS-14 TaxID=2590670 RepID=UPI00112A0F32|nr:DUF3291 domain-containing protein [Aestuariibacter sp. GS-14]TPV55643.1 DUF3291 domain-containing protein [Aestuariibacter sp. GS-14]